MYTDDLEKVVDAERQHFRGLYPDNEEEIVNTAWIFSYVTFGEGSFGADTLRMSTISSSGNVIGPRHFVDNYPYVIPPPGATERDRISITDALRKKIKPIDQFKTIPESIDYHCQIIARQIRSLARKYHLISSSCQIGIHAIAGLRGISPIIKETDTCPSITLKPPRAPPSEVSTLRGLTTLTNEGYGFAITYPKTCKIEEAPNALAFVRVVIFLPEDDYTHVSVAIVTLEPSKTLDDLREKYFRKIRNQENVTFISDDESTVAGHPAYAMVFQAIGPFWQEDLSPVTQNVTFTAKQIYTVNNGALYILTYQAPEDKYYKHLAPAQSILASFNFVNRPK
jgi:hypothetical protein